jgi:putative transposase
MNSSWPHAPIHILKERGAYMVTAGTYKKELLFNSPEKLTMLHGTLLQLAKENEWELQAWAVMGNHYHFVAMSPGGPETLKKFISDLHRKTAMKLNSMDGTAGRKVWYQYWDSHITFEKSYLARLNYVHYNPAHHGLVRKAEDYEWCSASWFECRADAAFRKTVLSFDTSRINVTDEF